MYHSFKPDLFSEDGAVRAEAFESAVLRSLGVEVERLPIKALAAAYGHVSRQLLAAERGPSGRIGVPDESPIRPEHISWIWGLVYGARTFQVARRLLRIYPTAGPFVELGAGWGPFGLAASPMASRVTLVELVPERLERATALYRAAGAEEPELEGGDLQRSSVSEVGGLALPYVLSELVKTPEEGAKLIRRLMHRLKGKGRLYILVPGTRETARLLQGIRDALREEWRILGPCTTSKGCPLLDDPRGWCHFTWHDPLGPVARRIADRAKRKWSSLHVSWMVLERADPNPGGGGRVLEVSPSGKGKIGALVCGEEGIIRLTALRKESGGFRRVAALEPGDVVEVAGGEEKGDGLRIRESGDLRLVSEPSST